MNLPSRISLVTLGVCDVARSTEFYRALGWHKSSASVDGEVSFFNNAGSRLALWRAEALAQEVGTTPNHVGFGGVVPAINCDSRVQVDELFEAVVAADGKVARAPMVTDWGGYSGHFTDVDGHIWEVAHNPAWPIGDDELPQLPD